MGNQSISIQRQNFETKTLDFENSHTTRLHQIENSTLLKCGLNSQSSYISIKDRQQTQSQPLFYLQKIFITDSQEQYRLLAKYLEKQSMLNSQSQSSQILKIVKIYQQSQKGLCSNHYLIRVLFQYSDITIRDQLRIRSMKKQKNTLLEDSPYFRYEDLCSIIFACISSLYTVEKMKEHLKIFVKNKLSEDESSFKHLDSLLHQYKFNIPFNLDRIIIMPDGTIKVLHPLILDHDNRVHYSNKFYYSPQKMKDFLLDDGIKGRIFETALIVLQCALIQSTQKMNKIYNGYCINENVLNEKIQNAIKIYSQFENLTKDDMKLFTLIRKMTKVITQQRIGLDQCIKEAENLFQLNKKLKESFTQNLSSQRHNYSNGRMSVQELQFIPSHRMTLKSSPLQNSTAQNTAHAKCKFDRKSSSRQTSVGKTLDKEEKQNPEIQVSNFDFYQQNQRDHHKNHQKTSKNPFGSLLINNDHENFFKNNNQECLKSFLGQESNLYQTQKFNFLDSKFEYGKFYCNPIKNSIIEQRIDSLNSSNKKYSSSLYGKDLKYEKMLKQSYRIPSGKKYQGFIKQDLLRAKSKDSIILSQNFMDNEKIYTKYNFIQKSNDKYLRESKVQEKCSFMEIKDYENFHNQEQQRQNKEINIIPYAFSAQSSQEDINQNSKNSYLLSTDKKSQVLEKITSFHINQRIKRHRILR